MTFGLRCDESHCFNRAWRLRVRRTLWGIRYRWLCTSCAKNESSLTRALFPRKR